jgi:hypothetical protein
MHTDKVCLKDYNSLDAYRQSQHRSIAISIVLNFATYIIGTM